MVHNALINNHHVNLILDSLKLHVKIQQQQVEINVGKVKLGLEIVNLEIVQILFQIPVILIVLHTCLHVHLMEHPVTLLKLIVHYILI